MICYGKTKSITTNRGKGYTGDFSEILAYRLVQLEFTLGSLDRPTSPNADAEIEALRSLLHRISAWVENGQSLTEVQLQFPREIPDEWLYDEVIEVDEG